MVLIKTFFYSFCYLHNKDFNNSKAYKSVSPVHSNLKSYIALDRNLDE